MQAILIQIAIGILKYYADKIGVSVYDYLKEQEQLKLNKQKSEEYQKVIDKPSTREERRNAEDKLLS